MNIKVGETWRTRGGWLAEVIYDLGDETAEPIVAIHKKEGEPPCAETHSRSGQFFVNTKSVWDLMTVEGGK